MLNMVKFRDNTETVEFFNVFKDYFFHYMNEDKTNKVNISLTKFNSNVSLDEKDKIVHDLFLDEVCKYSGINKDLILGDGIITQAQMSSNRQLAWTAFAVVSAMVDAILPDVLTSSDTAMYTDYRFIDYGDSAAFDVQARDLFLVTKSGRNKRHQEARRQYKGQVTVDPVEHDVTVFVQLYRVLSGKESLAEFVAKAIKAMQNEMAIDAYTAFDVAFDALTPTYDAALYINGYSQNGAIGLAQRVSAWNSSQAVYVGTKIALQNILPNDANYRYTLESDYASLGYVKTAFGYDVLELPQRADWKTEFDLTLDDTKIYCISPGTDKMIKQVIQGDTLAIQDGSYDNADLTQLATLKKSWGQALCTSTIYGCIDLS